MAYNSFFPTGYYQPMYQPPQMMPVQSTMGQVNQQPQVNNTIIWVNSELEAQNYPVAPNNAVALWDSSRASIYLKQADASGRPSFKAFDLVDRKNGDLKAENTDLNNFINKEDLTALEAKIEALTVILNKELNFKEQMKPQRKDRGDNRE